MYGCYVVVLFLAGTYKGVGVLDAIYKVRTTLYHTLVDELLEGFVLDHNSEVIKEFVPETAVYQVSGGVFGTAYI